MTTIGYYVHHHGRGHLQRAQAIAAASAYPIAVLSSLPRPAGWAGEWVALARDDDGDPRDADAGGALHWVPAHHDGLRSRAAVLSAWIHERRPALMVVDVSVEVALLARLHGVPVATFVLPGDRGDRPHRLGYDIADLVLACWPPDMRGMVHGIDSAAGIRPVGAISRYRRRPGDPEPRDRSVLVLSGAGGTELDRGRIDAAAAATPDWRWTVLDGTPATWIDDPWPLICAAEVVITHAGQNALADVAAAGRPAIVVPQERPHDEQRTTARALAADGTFPVVVLDELPDSGWPTLLARAAALDGSAWRRWNDGLGAVRAAALLDAHVADREAAA